MKRILVTGGIGFIGSHFCQRLLREGEEVVCLGNFDPFYDPVIKRRNLAEGDRGDQGGWDIPARRGGYQGLYV